MKKSKLDTPHIKEQIVKGMASGASQTDLARQIGFDQSTISKFANREDIRELIEKEQKRLLEVVPDAVENVKALVKGMKDLPANDSKGRELAYKASKDVLKSVGLFPAHAPSTIYNQMIYNQNNAIISDRLMELLGKYSEDTHKLPEGITVE